MKVAIIGSRDYGVEKGPSGKYRRNLIELLVSKMDNEDYVISGGANGADLWAETFAQSYNIGRIIHAAAWKKYGKRAGHIRNGLIVKEADILFAFITDSTDSPGTANCLAQARADRVPAYVYDAKLGRWFADIADWPAGESRFLDNPDFPAILDDRRRVIESTAQRGEGAFISFDGRTVVNEKDALRPRPK